MRLYNAVCAWLEARTAMMSATDEPMPEGAGQSQAEHAHSFSAPPELHLASNREALEEDLEGGYRTRPIGFRRA